MAGNHRPTSRGRDRRPRGQAARSGRGPCTGPRGANRRLRKNGETTFGAVDRRPVRANNGKPGGSHPTLPGTTSCPKRRSKDRWCGRTLDDGRDCCAAGNRAARSRWVPAPIPLAPYYYLSPIRARRLQSAGSPDSTRGWVLILTIHSWRIIRFGAGDHKRDRPEDDRAGLKAGGSRMQGAQPGLQRRAACGVSRSRRGQRVSGGCRWDG